MFLKISFLANKIVLSYIPSCFSTQEELFVPSFLRITHPTAKWGQVLPRKEEEGEEEVVQGGLSHWRRIPRRLQLYYGKLEKDEAVLEEARKLSN